MKYIKQRKTNINTIWFHSYAKYKKQTKKTNEQTKWKKTKKTHKHVDIENRVAVTEGKGRGESQNV